MVKPQKLLRKEYILLFVLLFSVRANADIHFSPLFDYRSDEETKDIDALGPIFSYGHTPEKKSFSIRPLISYQRTPEQTSWHFLYPLFRYERGREETKFSLLLLANKERGYTEIFPFFWGKTKDGERYRGFFPFYGKFRDRFGKDEITFTLWPIYTFSREGELRTYRFFGPIFTYHKGSGRKAIKFLPFYGRDEKEGEFYKRFYLWPIIIHQRTDLDTSPKYYFSVFPFYISQKTLFSRSTTILWPFFYFYRCGDYRRWDFPWPFFSWAKGDHRKEIKFLPLFSYKRTKKLKSFYILYPLYKHELDTTIGEKIVTDYFVFFNRYERRYDKEGKPTLKLFKFLPIFYYRSQAEQVKSYFPAILPIEHEGFERNITPLLRIYYHESGLGYEYTNLLWGTYRYKKTEELESKHFSFLLGLEKRANYKKVSLLAGIFQYITEKERRYFKIFYLLKF
ncbi:MAG: hypothetical protein AMJ45_01165 [Syntrophobacter sp. DG_60]|nr:MAG: hypothetical protein AMJ45_01165 [Syntrophobacter sp. DG_60]